MKKSLRYLISAPTFFWGALYVYGACLLRLAKAPAVEQGLFVAVWRPWFAKRWRYSTTVGRGIIQHPDHLSRPEVFEHEKVHTRQGEDLCLHGLVGALLAWLWANTVLGLLLWFLAPSALLLNYGMAWLRGSDPYRDAEHERSAYAQTEL